MTTKEQREAVLENLRQGVTIDMACKSAGIARDTYYKWRQKSKEFKRAIKEAKNSRIEKVEDALLANAVKGNITAQIFFLCNRAKQDWESVNKVEHRGGIEVNLKSEMEKINKNLDGRRKGHKDGLSKRSK